MRQHSHRPATNTPPSSKQAVVVGVQNVALAKHYGRGWLAQHSIIEHMGGSRRFGM